MENLRDYIQLLLDVSPSTGNYLKPDFTGFHHFYAYVSAYGPQAAMAAGETVDLFKNTSYCMSEDELRLIKGYAKELYFYSHTDNVPLGLSGRFPHGANRILNRTYFMLPLLAMAGDEADEELLQIIANTYKSDYARIYNPCHRLSQTGFPGYQTAMACALDEIKARKITVKPQLGVRIYPYGPHAAIRQDNWMAVIKGMNKWLWSYEGGITATNKENLYGVYQSHGTLELYYIDPADPTGGSTLNAKRPSEGFDWSHRAGTTAPFRTPAEMLADAIVSRCKPNTTDVGGVHLYEENGLFMFDLNRIPEEMVDMNFRAKKTYFLFGQRIYMLGSHISNGRSRKYPIHTALFQNYLNQQNRTLTPIYDNGAVITADSYEKSRTGKDSITLVDADGTSYYIKERNGLHVERRYVASRSRKAQDDANPTYAYRAIAWIDHGMSPRNATYEYVILPNTDASTVADFQIRQDSGEIYEVIEKTAAAHILHDKELKLWGYALFENFDDPNKGPLCSVRTTQQLPHAAPEGVVGADGYCVIIDKSINDTLKLGVSYTDLRLYSGYKATYGVPNQNNWDFDYDYFSAPVIVEIKIKGIWNISGTNQTVSLINHNNNITTLRIQCSDGLSENVTLK
jgi:hypothetical protein